MCGNWVEYGNLKFILYFLPNCRHINVSEYTVDFSVSVENIDKLILKALSRFVADNTLSLSFFFFFFIFSLKTRLDIYCESSVWFRWNIKTYFLWKIIKRYFKMSSATVVISVNHGNLITDWQLTILYIKVRKKDGYHSYPKYSDRWACENSVDPDQMHNVASDQSKLFTTCLAVFQTC